MLKCKKILLSLLLCITLFSVSCFATTMSESEIKSYFDNNSDLYVATTIFTVNDGLDAIVDYAENHNITLSDNYICNLYDESDEWLFEYYDLGNETIDSISLEYSNLILSLTGEVDYYRYSLDSAYFGGVSNVSNIVIRNTNDSDDGYLGNTFDTVFTYSSNVIFTEPSSPSPSPSGIFVGILATMTYILASITTVMNSLVQVDLILFVILASLCISIIYFVVKLLKGFTGNKLVSGKKKRK